MQTRQQKRLRKQVATSSSKDDTKIKSSTGQGVYEGLAPHSIDRISQDIWGCVLTFLQLKEVSCLTLTCKNLNFCSLSFGKGNKAFIRPAVSLKQYGHMLSEFRLIRKAFVEKLDSAHTLIKFCNFNASTLSKLDFKIDMDTLAAVKTPLRDILLPCQNLSNLTICLLEPSVKMSNHQTRFDLGLHAKPVLPSSFPHMTSLNFAFPTFLKDDVGFSAHIILTFLELCPHLKNLMLSGMVYEHTELKKLGKYCPKLQLLNIQDLVLWQFEHLILYGDLLQNLNVLVLDEVLVNWKHSTSPELELPFRQYVPPISTLKISVNVLSDPIFIEDLDVEFPPFAFMLQNVKYCENDEMDLSFYTRLDICIILEIIMSKVDIAQNKKDGIFKARNSFMCIE